MAIIRKTFKSGDSTVITIPSKFAVKPGIHFAFEKKGEKIIMEPLIK